MFSEETENRLKSFVKTPYRSEMGIISDVLDTIMEGGMHGVIASTLSRRANLSYNTLAEKCKKLVDAGLIRSARAERKVLFKITEKGIWFFRELQKFEEFATQINVRY